MISAEIMLRLSALEMSTEAFREVLSIIAELQAADDTRREGQRQCQACNARKKRNTERMALKRSVRTQYAHSAHTEVQEIPPTPPKEIISNLLTFSKDKKVGKEERSEIVALGDWPRDFREQFWAAYPKRVDKAGAMRKLDHVRRSGVSFVALMSAVERYAALRLERQFTKSPLVWLNKGCWDDEHSVDTAPVAIKGFHARDGSPEMAAWDGYWLHTKGILAPRSRRIDGYIFSTQWPPGHPDHDNATVRPVAPGQAERPTSDPPRKVATGALGELLGATVRAAVPFPGRADEDG